MGCFDSLMGTVYRDFDNRTEKSEDLNQNLKEFIEAMRTSDASGADFVTLTTIHQAKGLEWPVVVFLLSILCCFYLATSCLSTCYTVCRTF